ncbi:MAG TPA: DUF4112 domain-containing protein [Polyangiaceae bacterium]|nr:DUF4112 domain-containing protein [Polyangiaceae bacterium]
MSPASPPPKKPASPSSGASPPEPIPSWARLLTHWLDEAIPIPGTKIKLGIEAVLGFLLPGIGDGVGALAGLSIIALALRRKVPAVILARMVLNLAVDGIVGAVPLLGDVFDVAFRANRKNLDLLERYAGASRASPGWVDYALLGGAVLAALLAVAMPVFLIGWLLSKAR